jgi:hypothetical protein
MLLYHPRNMKEPALLFRNPHYVRSNFLWEWDIDRAKAPRSCEKSGSLSNHQQCGVQLRGYGESNRFNPDVQPAPDELTEEQLEVNSQVNCSRLYTTSRTC